jgi:hypothetical protein
MGSSPLRWSHSIGASPAEPFETRLREFNSSLASGSAQVVVALDCNPSSPKFQVSARIGDHF